MLNEWVLDPKSIEVARDGLLDADFSAKWQTSRLAVHVVTLPPLQRSSTPHAESHEEEFVYVKKGRPHVWINGFIYALEPGLAVGFPAGTGIAHGFINNTQDDVELVVLGERSKKENRYIYPLNPELYEDHRNFWWTDWPKQEMGPHLGAPGDLDHLRDWRELDFVKSIHELERGKSFSYPGDNETFSRGIRLTDHLGLKFLGVWHHLMEPGARSSWPHAHKLEEEFALVLAGKAKVWINGYTFDVNEAGCAYFKPGTHLAHTLINESDSEIEFLCIGEADDAGPQERIVYPLHPHRNQICRERGWLWEDPPTTQLGDDLGLPVLKKARVEMLEGAVPFFVGPSADPDRKRSRIQFDVGPGGTSSFKEESR